MTGNAVLFNFTATFYRGKKQSSETHKLSTVKQMSKLLSLIHKWRSKEESMQEK